MSHRRAKRIRKMLRMQFPNAAYQLYKAIKQVDKAQGRRQKLPTLKDLHKEAQNANVSTNLPDSR